MEYLDYITLTGILILVSLFLNNYEPPIKRQNIALIVMAFGLVLGWFMVHNAAYGFLIAGLVFFKDEFINETSLVSASFKKLRKEKEVALEDEDRE